MGDRRAGSSVGGDHRAGVSDSGGLPGRARLGIGVLLTTAVLATLTAVGGHAMVEGPGLSLPVPDAAGVRGVIPPTSASGTGEENDAEPTESNRARQPPRKVDEAERLLARQAAAVRDGDRDEYLSTIDPDSPDFADLAARTFDNLDRLPVERYRFGDIVEDAGALPPDRREALDDSAWVGEVDVVLQFEGEDSGWWSTSLRVTFVNRSGDFYVANDTEGQAAGQPRPLWLTEEISVARGSHSLVIGTGSAERLEGVADIVDESVPAANDLWRRAWDEHVVVIAPETQQQMEQAIGAGVDSQSKVAAVTTSVGRHGRHDPSHVVINPANYDEIGSFSRQVVLTHEIVHVATEATTSTVPVWLSEGFADYVAFKGSGLGQDRIAHGLLNDVAENGPPTDLPDSSEFDPREPELDHAYEASWMACVYIAETWGEDTLVDFYEEMAGVATARDEAQVYREAFGLTPTVFVDRWKEYVDESAPA